MENNLNINSSTENNPKNVSLSEFFTKYRVVPFYIQTLKLLGVGMIPIVSFCIGILYTNSLQDGITLADSVEIIPQTQNAQVIQTQKADAQMFGFSQRLIDGEPMLSTTSAAELLYNLEINYQPISMREIVLTLTGDDERMFGMLQVYASRNVDLILAFSGDVSSIDRYTTPIVDFLGRMKDKGLNQQWMSQKLQIEPMNEINAAFQIHDLKEGDPAYHAKLDLALKRKLAEKGIPHRELLSSSIISSTHWAYLDWFWKYYQAGGPGSVNIHLYMAPEDGSSYTNMLKRWGDVVWWLKNHSGSPGNRVYVTEIGVPRFGCDGCTGHDKIIADVTNDERIKLADKVIFWRLLSDWLSIDCTDQTCGRDQASETTYGFIHRWTGAPEAEFKKKFLPFGFWWNPEKRSDVSTTSVSNFNHQRNTIQPVRRSTCDERPELCL